MSVPSTSADLLDLKLMPAWVNEPARTNDYADYEGEVERPFDRDRRGPRRGGEQRPRGAKPRERRDDRQPPDQRRPERGSENRPPREAPAPLPEVNVRFVPHPAAFESVIAQIKSNVVTYSVFALARLFLDKPERYDVRLTAAEGAELHQLGENGPVATDQRILEGSAFSGAKDDYYNAEITQSEPLKGNFTNVARDRASGTLLGPTNHHNYQPQLRGLYEQRYSRRMSFQDFQRGIEIVSDPAVIEQWKEQARSVTTYTTKNAEPPVGFKSLAEVEHHFRQHYLPTLWRSAREVSITGVASRRLPDRALGRVIENAWAAEIRSPSQMMAELAGGLRGGGLNIFRHRRGMLFVSPVRLRPFNHESTSVSSSINAILANVSEVPGIGRKQLADKLVSGVTEPAEADRIKLSLAADLRWLISEGYLIEFNDGSLDLPRTKPPAPATPTKSGKAVVEVPVVPQAEETDSEPVAENAIESAASVQPEAQDASVDEEATAESPAPEPEEAADQPPNEDAASRSLDGTA